MKDVINTYGEAVIGMCAVVVAMTMIGMSMSAYRNILLGVIGYYCDLQKEQTNQTFLHGTLFIIKRCLCLYPSFEGISSTIIALSR